MSRLRAASALVLALPIEPEVIMQTPPFQLARTHAHAHGDASCQPGEAVARPARRRARLAELDSHLHCSVIGTCLSTGELRKLVPKFTDLDRYHASDLEIHHAAVELAIAGGAGAKALHKALDERYSGAIRRFDSARDTQALLDLWNEALKSGDLPPAYWAVMSHPHASIEVRQYAFGELHMLSHLVGAANRADIRRLVALEAENQELGDKLERHQARVLELSAERDAAAGQAHELALQLAARRPERSTIELDDEIERLREKVEDGEQRLALHTSRRESLEQRVLQQEEQSRALRNSLGEAQALLKVVQAECAALERATLAAGDEPGTRRRAVEWLKGKRIVYVGGRPNSNALLRSLTAAAGGELVVHDGGIEDRKGLLAAALPNADAVLFPVDCIDHDSMNMLKRVCERHGVPYSPLRTASVASFVEFIGRLGAGTRDVSPASPPPSAFCLRHG